MAEMTSRQYPIIESAADLRAQLEHHNAPAKVIAFDIFGTVLESDADTPGACKRILAGRIVRTLSESFGIGSTIEHVLESLQQIENNPQLRQPDSTVRDHEIAQALAIRLTNGDSARAPSLAARIIEHARAAEAKALFIKPGMAALLEWLQQHNKRIVAISGKPLDPARLHDLFRQNGFTVHFDSLYVFPESGTAGQRQSFFARLLREEGLQPRELLHIADYRQSARHPPAAMGIVAIRLEDTESIRRRHTLRVYRYLAQKNPYWRGRHLLQLIRPGEAQGFHFNYGYEILGPIYAAYILGVIEEVKKDKIRQVFFLAREGELFIKLFELLRPDFFEPEQMPAAHYLYVSRRSTAAAAAYHGLRHEMAITPLFNPKQQGLLSICQAFGLPPEALSAVFRKHDYHTIEHPIADWESDQFHGLLNDPEFQHIVQRCTAENWHLLHRYLQQEHFFSDDKIAIADIGWNGTTQKFLQEAFGQEKNYPHVLGLYFGFIGGRQYRFDPQKNTLRGILCDERHKARPGNIFSRFEEIFEEGARALHPTTIGYRIAEDSGRIVPVFKPQSDHDRQAELSVNAHIAGFHAGVLAFAAEFARVIALTGYSLNDIKPFILTLAERAVAFPAPGESRQLLQLEHAEDFGSAHVMNFHQEKLDTAGALSRPWNLLNTLKTANWKYGAAATSGIPGLNAAIRLYDLVKSK
ncbi:MAG: HAD family hydrolase [Proteobacteria bacterium]|nr:HAD family hydrolase [Pseudomonadota bacterium]